MDIEKKVACDPAFLRVHPFDFEVNDAWRFYRLANASVGHSGDVMVFHDGAFLGVASPTPGAKNIFRTLN